MEELEKVEKLRERANVTYEDAKAALEACNWDMLDAMVYLEKQGKVKEPGQSTYSTSYEEQKQYESVKEKVGKKNSGEGFWAKFRRLCNKIWKTCRDNYLCVYQKDEEIIRVPVWGFILALWLAWEIILIIMVVSLFFDCRYSFSGKNNCEKINNAMAKATDFADKVKDEYEKL